MSVVSAAVGRAPIVDQDRCVVGYELLFQTIPEHISARPEAAAKIPLAAMGEGASSSADTPATHAMLIRETVFDTLGLGLHRVAGDKTLFCRAPHSVVTGATPVTLPAHRTVLELATTDVPADELHAGAHRLRDEGFQLAISDFAWNTPNRSLLPAAHIVKIDMRTTPVLTIPRLLDRCRHFNVQLLAENVETDDELALCMELGFDLFQGLPLGRPQTVSGQVLHPEQHSMLRLAGEVMDPDTDFGRLEEIVRTDPALAYRVVQLASIGRLGEFGRDVRSIREALVAIGINRLRGWLPALLLRPDGPAVASALPIVLARARMAELFAQVTSPEESGFAFTAGMISALDLLLGLPRTELSAALDIPSDLRAAAFRTDTPMGRLIQGVIAYQQRADASFTGIDLDATTVATVGAHAFTWALDATNLIDQPMAA